MKILKIIFLCLILIGVSGSLFMGCMTFRKSSEKISKDLNESKIKHTIKKDSFINYQPRYIEYIKDKELPYLVFIHGAPGSSTAFTDYIKDTSLNQEYNMIVVDRIGYGYSNYGTYAPINKQAEWIKNLVLSLNIPNSYLVGHSFGGPIAALAAIKLKKKIKGSIMIAPAIDPENEKYFFGGKLAWWKATSWMFSKAWRVSAKEKYRHVEELKGLKDEWGKVQSPILHIHGTDDKLVPFINLDFSKKNFPNGLISTEAVKGKGHLLPFTDPQLCISLIKNFIKGNK